VVPTKRTGEQFVDENGRRSDIVIESLPDHEHPTLDLPSSPGIDLRPTQIEDGRYLMMGDNRDNSRDGREWGTITREEMRGPAMFLYWSWDSEGYSWLQMLNPITWWDLIVHRMRWDRIGDSVH
jgi:hypothetical protein